MTFCELEKDEKTFEYVQKYIEWHSSHTGENFLQLDSEIQKKEILLHLESNNLVSEEKTKEMIKWIRLYSEKFRIYLNTIKVVFAVWYCSGHDEAINWKEFCKIVDKIDEIKNGCLDDIMIEADASSLDHDTIYN